MRSGFVGLAEDSPELADDPTSDDDGVIYDVCYAKTHPEVHIAAIQAVPHAEDVVEEPETEINDDLPVVMSSLTESLAICWLIRGPKLMECRKSSTRRSLVAMILR